CPFCDKAKSLLKTKGVEYISGLQTLFNTKINSKNQIRATINKTGKEYVTVNIDNIISFNRNKDEDINKHTVLIKYGQNDQPSFGIMKAARKCEANRYALYSSQIYGKADDDKNLDLSSPIADKDEVVVLLKKPFFSTQTLTGSILKYDVRSIIRKKSSQESLWKWLYDKGSVVAVQPNRLSDEAAMISPALQKATIVGAYKGFGQKDTREFWYLVDLKNK
ncbi:MAG: hypothetical protein ACPGLR_03860, partial [Flavobacteriaceae bacterium]